MAIEAIYRRPNPSKPAPEHRIYPCLLRGLPITRLNLLCPLTLDCGASKEKLKYRFHSNARNIGRGQSETAGNLQGRFQ
jgi:hypothetical protein